MYIYVTQGMQPDHAVVDSLQQATSDVYIYICVHKYLGEQKYVYIHSAMAKSDFPASKHVFFKFLEVATANRFSQCKYRRRAQTWIWVSSTF